MKKQQQNLEYKFKQLKQRSHSTGEAGINSIKHGFSYFDFFVEVMGQSDRADPSKVEIEDSTTFSSNGDSVGEGAAHQLIQQVQT